ncbi:MAG: CAP domain-containing protein [Myxococcota bacterium]
MGRLGVVVLLVGCTGTLSTTPPEADARVEVDGGRPAVDAATDAAGFDGAIDRDSAVGRDGAVGRDSAVPDTGPGDPCEGVSCGAMEVCDPATASCVCRGGFVDNGSGCEAPAPGDPATRTAAEVCDSWSAGRVENASPAWMDDGSSCGPGTLSRDAVDDTLRRVNVYRWLSGLRNVVDNPAIHDASMECAAMMSANRALSHGPPPSWDCYTDDGAGAAASSNIALGVRSSPQAIDLYMEDRGTPSLGHRRWILGGNLDNIGIGFSNVSGRGGQCLGVFGRGAATERGWSAYPNQGPTPVTLATQQWWSFHTYSVRLEDASVSITRVSDGAPLEVTTDFIAGRGPPPSLRIERQGWTPTAGETYRVTVSLSDGSNITYDVMPVDC